MNLIANIKDFFSKRNFFKTKNKSGKERSYESPSLRYELIVTSYETKPGCWNYTKGDVYKDGVKIFTVKRNYSSFWHAFIEDHPNGHDYLLCGEDYQGQTVLELDTGKRIDYLPDEASKGVGFCWTDVKPNLDKNIIAVEGCYWACPYETVMYDFSNPMKLPYKELGRLDLYSESESKWITNEIYHITEKVDVLKTTKEDINYIESDLLMSLCQSQQIYDESIETIDGGYTLWSKMSKNGVSIVVKMEFRTPDRKTIVDEGIKVIEAINTGKEQYYNTYEWVTTKEGNDDHMEWYIRVSKDGTWNDAEKLNFKTLEESNAWMENKLQEVLK